MSPVPSARYRENHREFLTMGAPHFLQGILSYLGTAHLASSIKLGDLSRSEEQQRHDLSIMSVVAIHKMNFRTPNHLQPRRGSFFLQFPSQDIIRDE